MTLRLKLVVVLIGVMLFSGALTLGLIRNVMRGILIQNVTDKGLSEATLEASVMSAGFQARNEKLLLPHLLRLQDVMGAAYVMALDPNGTILAHTEVSQTGHQLTDRFTMALLNAQQPLAQADPESAGRLLEIVVPVRAASADNSGEAFLFGPESSRQKQEGPWLGAIRMAVPMKETFNIQSQVIGRLTMIMVVATLIGILAAWLWMRSVLLPIQQLVQGTQRISEGSYATEIPVASRDELGTLAQSFNRMSKTLSETTVSKNFLGNILSNMSDALIVLTGDGTVAMVNQTTLKLLGYEENEVVGRPSSLLFPDKERLPPGADLDAFLGNSSIQDVETQMQTKSGVQIPVLFSSVTLRGKDGQVMEIIATAKDMTERKKLEGVIRQSEKMSAVGQLAAGVAHEINNPLGVILGFATEIVQDLRLEDPLTMPLKSIEREALRCKNLVQDLLVFSHVARPDRESVDLNHAVDGALSLVAAQARVANVKVTKEFGPDLPRVVANLNQVQQVIINLANNAFDAMRQSGGELTLKTESLREGALTWVCLRIADTGAGIPENIRSRIFDPFFTTKPVGKGTGLGLSLVHEIVKKHSGVIDVESGPGRTEFCIKLPARGAVAIPPAP